MKKSLTAALCSLLVAAGALANPMVGGDAMCETKDIVENALNSKDHTTLVAAVKATLKTVEGETLWIAGQGAKLTLTDEKAGTSMITISDVRQKNGVIQVVDKVLLPK